MASLEHAWSTSITIRRLHPSTSVKSQHDGMFVIPALSDKQTPLEPGKPAAQPNQSAPGLVTLFPNIKVIEDFYITHTCTHIHTQIE